MPQSKVVVSDYYYENLDAERNVLAGAGATLADFHCKTEDEVIEAARDCDALIVQFAPITRRVVESLSRCRIIVRYAIGVDNIDTEAAAEHGIYVANVPDYGTDEVSNHACALLLSCARKLGQLSAAVKRGVWDYTAAKPIMRLSGKTLGLVGFGRIPMLVGKKMSAFSMNILAHDPYASPDAVRKLGAELVGLDALLERSDFVSVHCPLNDSTRHMFGRGQFKRMKNTAFFVNTARGGVVNEADLVAALEHGEIAGAGLDVLEKEPADKANPLLAMENVVVTPHVAWYSVEAVADLQRKAAEEVARVLTGGEPLNPVNRPVAKKAV